MVDFKGDFAIINYCGATTRLLTAATAANARISGYHSTTYNTRVEAMTGFGTG